VDGVAITARKPATAAIEAVADTAARSERSIILRILPGLSAGIADRCSLHRHDEWFSSIATLPVLQIRNGDRLNPI
jgi:hypothetical protein